MGDLVGLCQLSDVEGIDLPDFRNQRIIHHHITIIRYTRIKGKRYLTRWGGNFPSRINDLRDDCTLWEWKGRNDLNF